jgi:threonine aldolase
VLAEGIAELPDAAIDPSLVETNIVIFEVEDPAGVVAGLLAEGVEMQQMGPGRIRAVTHMDVDRAGVDRALDVLGRLLG